MLSKELEKPGPLILPNCCKAAGNNYHYLIIIDHNHHDIINQYKELRYLDVMTIFSQSGSQVSVSRRSEALGSFSSANLSQWELQR